METVTTSMTTTDSGGDSDGYPEFAAAVRQRFADAVRQPGTPLFTTSAEDLFTRVFLPNLPEVHRQHYNCHACRRFIDAYGGLVTIGDDGLRELALWPATADTPPFFADAVQAVRNAVRGAKVTGVFLSSESTLGQPVTGTWHHLAATLPKERVYRATVLTASQVMAEKTQDRITLVAGLREFPRATVAEAHKLLTDGQLFRSEKCKAVAKWLLALHDAQVAASKPAAENLIWRAVALAPPGFCHVRSTMIGTLLEDIQAGLPFDAIKRRFDSKMNPTVYQRPYKLDRWD